MTFTCAPARDCRRGAVVDDGSRAVINGAEVTVSRVETIA